ncbi:Pyrroline-5-carboxylate reductase [Nymphon striatum]|nr:Pyrroline-5-carboxylate reductase [Nymphon striatum]
MLEGWLAGGIKPTAVYVLDPYPSEWVKAQGVHINTDLPENPAIALLAVKPQMMGDALPRMASLGNGSTLFLSIAAGVAEGLPADMAMQLAKATVAGAGALAEAAQETPEQLRINVTSPAGTTAAALEILMDKETGFPKLLRNAVSAAAERGRELGK